MIFKVYLLTSIIFVLSYFLWRISIMVWQSFWDLRSTTKTRYRRAAIAGVVPLPTSHGKMWSLLMNQNCSFFLAWAKGSSETFFSPAMLNHPVKQKLDRLTSLPLYHHPGQHSKISLTWTNSCVQLYSDSIIQRTNFSLILNLVYLRQLPQTPHYVFWKTVVVISSKSSILAENTWNIPSTLHCPASYPG